MPEKIKVFISYKHGNEDHQNWVKKLATDLIEVYGIDCCLDQFEICLGGSLHKYMQKIKTESTHVLFIITPEAVASLESNKGGISFEAQLWSALRDREELRVIPILKEGNQTAAYVEDHLYIDFREDLRYESNLDKLEKDIKGIAEKPTLNIRKGERPTAAGDSRIFQPVDMVTIPKGRFLYGDEKLGKDIPYDYKMDVFPVTNRQYKEFLDDQKDHEAPYVERDWAKPYNWDKENRAYPEGMENHPVALVSYQDAVAFCKWRSQKEGLNGDKVYRLPTEEEWEKAARGTDGRIYPWGDEFDQGKCNTYESDIGKTTPVTSYPQGASPYKCQDMVGNVWEWTESWYNEDKSTKVLRGGSWYDTQHDARCASRNRYAPDNRYNDLGFRCARTL